MVCSPMIKAQEEMISGILITKQMEKTIKLVLKNKFYYGGLSSNMILLLIFESFNNTPAIRVLASAEISKLGKRSKWTSRRCKRK